MSHSMTKLTKWFVRPVKTQISQCIRPVWSESSLCAQWVAQHQKFLHADSEDWSESPLGAQIIFVGFVMRRLKYADIHRNEPRHDKTNKVSVRPAKTQISPVWSETSLSAWRNLGSLATHWAQSKDSDQTRRMPRLIWVFAGRTLTLLVLSCRGSNGKDKHLISSKCNEY